MSKRTLEVRLSCKDKSLPIIPSQLYQYVNSTTYSKMYLYGSECIWNSGWSIEFPNTDITIETEFLWNYDFYFLENFYEIIFYAHHYYPPFIERKLLNNALYNKKHIQCRWKCLDKLPQNIKDKIKIIIDDDLSDYQKKKFVKFYSSLGFKKFDVPRRSLLIDLIYKKDITRDMQEVFRSRYNSQD